MDFLLHQPQQIYIWKFCKKYVTAFIKTDEIKNQKIGDKKVQIKPGYMHKLSRKADGTPVIDDGQLAFEAEYDMEPVKPLDKEEKWNIDIIKC